MVMEMARAQRIYVGRRVGARGRRATLQVVARGGRSGWDAVSRYLYAGAARSKARCVSDAGANAIEVPRGCESVVVAPGMG